MHAAKSGKILGTDTRKDPLGGKSRAGITDAKHALVSSRHVWLWYLQVSLAAVNLGSQGDTFEIVFIIGPFRYFLMPSRQ